MRCRFAPSLVTYEHYPFQREQQPIANVKRLQKGMHNLKVVMSPIVIPYGEDKVFNIVHEASLENVFEELVGHNCPAGFYLKNDPTIGTQAVGIERFVDMVIQSKEHRNRNLQTSGFSGFNAESKFLQMLP